MGHVVLLGDSIFDNAAYVAGGPDVVRQVRERLPPGWRATLAAVDGSLVTDVRGQLARLPHDASHLVISAGGNDALQHVDLLDEPAQSTAEVLGRLAELREDFAAAYDRMLEAVLAAGRPTILCTIYDPCFPDAAMQRLAVTALSVFNGVITRLAGRAGVPRSCSDNRGISSQQFHGVMARKGKHGLGSPRFRHYPTGKSSLSWS